VNRWYGLHIQPKSILRSILYCLSSGSSHLWVPEIRGEELQGVGDVNGHPLSHQVGGLRGGGGGWNFTLRMHITSTAIGGEESIVFAHPKDSPQANHLLGLESVPPVNTFEHLGKCPCLLGQGIPAMHRVGNLVMKGTMEGEE
jgi:hypothetical protein